MRFMLDTSHIIDLGISFSANLTLNDLEFLTLGYGEWDSALLDNNDMNLRNTAPELGMPSSEG